MENSNTLNQCEIALNESKSNTTRRVGTLTFGGTLVAIGVFFLLHTIIPAVSYTLLLKLWPIIFISLGVEVLISGIKSGDSKIIYDKTGILLVFILTMFGLCMAFLAEMIRLGLGHIAM